MSKKHILIIFFIILFAVMQTSVFPYMLILGRTPSLLLVYVCVTSYFRGYKEGMYIGLTGGLFLDIIIGRSLGLLGLMYMLACFLIGSFPRKNIEDKFFIIMLFTMAIVFPLELIIYWLKKLSIFFSVGMSGSAIDTGNFIVKNLLPNLLYNCIIYVPVYFIAKKIDRFMNKDKRLMSGL